MVEPCRAVERAGSSRGATIGVLAAVVAILHVTNPQVGALYGKWESAAYVTMVDRPLASPINAYYGYRLLPPLLVRWLPVDHRVGFLIIDYASLLGAAYLTWSILRHEGCRPGMALLCAGLFLVLPCSTKWLATFSSGGDAFYLLLIAMLVRCIQVRWWSAFSIVLAAGIFTKYSALVLWPAALVYDAKCDRRTARSWPTDLATRLVAIVPAIGLLAIVWARWPAAPIPAELQMFGDPWARLVPAAILAPVENVLFHIGLKLSVPTEMFRVPVPQIVEVPAAFFIVFGVVAIVLANHARLACRVLVRHPGMLLLLLGSVSAGVIGSFDSERCQLYGAIPILYAFSRVVDSHAEIYDRWHVIAVLAVIELYLVNFSAHDPTRIDRYMSHYMGPETTWRYLLAWFVASLAIVLARRSTPKSASHLNRVP